MSFDPVAYQGGWRARETGASSMSNPYLNFPYDLMPGPLAAAGHSMYDSWLQGYAARARAATIAVMPVVMIPNRRFSLRGDEFHLAFVGHQFNHANEREVRA